MAQVEWVHVAFDSQCSGRDVLETVLVTGSGTACTTVADLPQPAGLSLLLPASRAVLVLTPKQPLADQEKKCDTLLNIICMLYVCVLCCVLIPPPFSPGPFSGSSA